MSDKDEIKTLPGADRSGFLENLAEKLGLNARAQTIFGPPVEREGLTVVPVASVRYGFGGGSGRREAGEEGVGGGGGMMARPEGYIEMRDNASYYHRIRRRSSLLPLAAIGGALALGFLGARGRLRPR